MMVTGLRCDSSCRTCDDHTIQHRLAKGATHFYVIHKVCYHRQLLLQVPFHDSVLVEAFDQIAGVVLEVLLLPRTHGHHWVARLPAVHAAPPPVGLAVYALNRGFKCGIVASCESGECCCDRFDILIGEHVDIVVHSEIGHNSLDT